MRTMWRMSRLAAALAALPAAALAPGAAWAEPPGACVERAPDPAIVARLQGERRVALLLGVGTYSSGAVAQLRNPPNDVEAMAGTLTGLGFRVFLAKNPASADAIRCADQARAAAPKPDVALFYFSGHGVQISDQNYLLAADADPAKPLKAGFTPADDLVERFAKDAGARLILLDACRNNPFSDGPSGLSASTGRGFVPAKAESGEGFKPAGDAPPRRAQARGVLVAYAAAPNAEALDGTGDLSPFAAALSARLPSRGYSVQRVMSEVTKQVGETTDWFQTPWSRSSLTSELKLAGPVSLEEAQIASQKWAGPVPRLMATQGRSAGLAAALKGLPAGISEAEARRLFPAAYAALTTAYLSQHVVVDESAYPDFGPASQLSPMALAPDGDGFVAGHDDKAGRMHLLLHRRDGSVVRRLLDGVRIEGAGAGQPLSAQLLTPVFAADRLAAVVGHELVFWRRSDGAELRRAAYAPAGKAGEAAYMTLRLSPSGRRALLKSSREAWLYDYERDAFFRIDEEAVIAALRPLSPAGHALADLSSAELRFEDDETFCLASRAGAGFDQLLAASLRIDPGQPVAASRVALFKVNDQALATATRFTLCTPRWVTMNGGLTGAVADRRTGAVIRDPIFEGANMTTMALDPGGTLLAFYRQERTVVYDLAARRVRADIPAARGVTPLLIGRARQDWVGAQVGGQGVFFPLWKPDLDLIRAAEADLSEALLREVAAERVAPWL